MADGCPPTPTACPRFPVVRFNGTTLPPLVHTHAVDPLLDSATAVAPPPTASGNPSWSVDTSIGVRAVAAAHVRSHRLCPDGDPGCVPANWDGRARRHRLQVDRRDVTGLEVGY